jgi:hypothetical protein
MSYFEENQNLQHMFEQETMRREREELEKVEREREERERLQNYAPPSDEFVSEMNNIALRKW